MRAVQGDEPVGGINSAGNQSDDRHDDIVDERVDNRLEGSADDNTDGQIHYAASRNKLPEFLNKTLHSILLFVYCNCFFYSEQLLIIYQTGAFFKHDPAPLR